MASINYWSKSYTHFLSISSNRESISYSGAGTPFSIGSAIAAKPLPLDCRVAYFEIEIVQAPTTCSVVVGLADRSHCGSRDIGMQQNSFGYSGESGHIHCSGNRFDRQAQFSTGDVIGCGVDYSEQSVFFTRNGRLIGRFGKLPDAPVAMYPAVSMSGKDEEVLANFSGPFRFSPAIVVSEAIVTEQAAIDCTHVDLSKDIIHEIIANYLSTQGYSETLRKLESRTYVSSPSISCEFRSKIRRLIEAGQILDAISELDNIHPDFTSTSESAAVAMLLSQQVTELLSNGDENAAIIFLKHSLSRFRNVEDPEVFRIVTDACMAVCSGSSDCGDIQSRRNQAARLINKQLLLLYNENHVSRLELFIKQAVACRKVSRDEHGRRGLIPYPELAYMRPRELARLAPNCHTKGVETDSFE